MKNLTYLFVIFSLILFTSCEKENVEPEIPEQETGIISLEDLNGTWEFVEYQYEGEVYTVSNALDGMTDIFHSMIFDTENMKWNVDYSFSINNDVLNVYAVFGTYENYTITSFANGELHLVLNETVYSYEYYGGTAIYRK